MSASEEHNTVAEPTAAMLQAANSSQFTVGDGSGSGSLEKIRDILFGNQMREYDKRFSRLEERLAKEYSDLREETRKRLDSLETYIQKEVGFLTERLKKDQTERDETQQQLTQELKELIKSLERKISQLDEQTSTSARDIRQQMLSQSKSIDEHIRQKSEGILAALERETQELRTAKTDRSALAAIFAELAMRLNNESPTFGNQ